MKRLFLIAALALSGCEFNRTNGACIGLADTERVTQHGYEVSRRNVIVALFLSGSLLVPGYVAAFDYKCPVDP